MTDRESWRGPLTRAPAHPSTRAPEHPRTRAPEQPRTRAAAGGADHIWTLREIGRAA